MNIIQNNANVDSYIEVSTVNNLAPVHLKELLYPYVPCRGLRSSENDLLVVPFTRSSVVHDLPNRLETSKRRC